MGSETVTKKHSLSRFGATVLSLCLEHGIPTRQKLVELLIRRGYTGEEGRPLYSHAKIGNWFYGRNAVDRRFCVALVDVLNLGPEERHRLAMAFTFGQDEEVGDRE